MVVEITKQQTGYVLVLNVGISASFVSKNSFKTKQAAICFAKEQGFEVLNEIEENENTTYYTAQEIADYVLWKIKEHHHSITYLQLHFILYDIQRKCLQTGIIAFDDDFVATNAGPVIPEIYESYKKFAGTKKIEKIESKNIPTLSNHFYSIINPIIKEKENLFYGEMYMQEFNNVESAWLNTYTENPNTNAIIPKELIKYS